MAENAQNVPAYDQFFLYKICQFLWFFETLEPLKNVWGCRVLHFKFAIGSGEVVLKNQISWFYIYSTHNSDRPKKVKKSRKKNQFFNKFRIYRLQAWKIHAHAWFFPAFDNIGVISHFNLVDIWDDLMAV